MSRRTFVAVAVAAVAVGVAGCGSPTPPRAASARTPTATATATATSATRADRCVAQVVFWTPKTLARDPSALYGDYQDLGLTAAEYAALTHTVALARRHLRAAVTPDAWTAADRDYVARQARVSCRVVTTTAPSRGGYGWPDG